MTPHHIDTSDDYFAECLRAAYAAYDKYLTTGANTDLAAWVKLDRECSRIRDARQREAQKQGRELKVRMV